MNIGRMMVMREMMMMLELILQHWFEAICYVGEITYGLGNHVGWVMMLIDDDDVDGDSDGVYL